MEVHKPTVAGTLESSDCQTIVESGEGNIEFALENAVTDQHGNRIERVVMETLESLGVKDVRITITDKGALDCTIRARMGGAVFRVAGQCDNPPWGGAIR